MPDRVEEILKKIHVMLAKCEAYNDSPDKVIISKKEMFRVLEELNEAVYEVMDNYEATARSREKARLEMDKQAAAVVAEARHSAEEVNAASLMYTDNMLDEVRLAVEESQKKLKRECEELMERFKEECEYIEQNKKEIKEQLSQMHEADRYFQVLQDVRKKAERKSRAEDDEGDDEEEEPVRKAPIVVNVYKPGEGPGVTVFNKKRAPKKTKEEKRRMLEELKRSEAANDESAAANEGKSRADEDPLQDDLPEAPVYGEKIYTPDDFDLDREYYEWKSGSDEENAENRQSKRNWLDGILNRKK